MWLELNNEDGPFHLNMDNVIKFSWNTMLARTDLVSIAPSGTGVMTYSCKESPQDVENKIVEEQRRLSQEAANFARH